jgi:hypothetical protein
VLNWVYEPKIGIFLQEMKKSMKKSKKALYITIKSVTKQKFIKMQICIHAM